MEFKGLSADFEQISNLTIVFIVSIPSPRLLLTTGVPHIHFAPYTRNECIEIISQTPQPIFIGALDPNVDYREEEAEEDSKWLWNRYLGVLWDSIGKGAARDLGSFRIAAFKLWRPFVQPIVEGTFGTRDFARLMVSRRPLFQGEQALTGADTSIARGIISLPSFRALC